MKSRRLKSGCMSEDDEQRSFVTWLELCRSNAGAAQWLENFTAIPNGGMRPQRVDAEGTRYSNEGRKLREMGVSDGYPDVLLDEPAGGLHGWRCEFKSAVGKPRPSQTAWIARLEARGYRASVARTWRPAARDLVNYLAPVLPANVRINMLRLVPAW